MPFEAIFVSVYRAMLAADAGYLQGLVAPTAIHASLCMRRKQVFCIQNRIYIECDL